MNKNLLDDYQNAYLQSFDYHDENVLMLSSYANKIERTIQEKKCKSLLSLGIGHEIVSKTLLKKLKDKELEKYYIVEGSSKIIENYKSNNDLPENIIIKEAYFESFECDIKFDAIEMGFVLEHVDNPLFILKRFSGLLNKGASIYIAVPNAKSLHRQIGFEAGILQDVYTLGKGDIELGHKRYFDIDSIRELIINAGFKIEKEEGLFLKPFTTSQIKTLNFDKKVLEALNTVGNKYPEIANAIYIEARI